MIVFAAIQLAALGFVLAIVGWRGRLVNNHPICRKCGFDLVGIATAALRCPECGWNLRGHDRTAAGRRHRRPVLIIIGLLLMISGSGLAFGRHSIRPWLEHYRAFEALRAAARGGSLADQEEILARIQGDRVTRSQMRRLVADALELQRVRSVDYGAWGDIFDALGQKNAVTAEQLEAYLQNMLLFELSTRPVVAAGSPIAIELTAIYRGPLNSTQLPNWRHVPRHMQIHTIRGSINGEPAPVPLPRYFGQHPAGFDYSGHWAAMRDVLPLAPANEGQHALNVVMEVEYTGPLDIDWAPPAPRINTRWTVALVSNFEVTAAARSQIATFSDPAAHTAFERNFTGRIVLPPVNPIYTKGPHVSLSSNIFTRNNALPDAAFDVYLQIGDQEHWISTMLIDGPHVLTPFLQLDADHPAATEIAEARIILRPSIDAARQSLHLERIWTGPDIIITPKIVKHPH